MRVFALLLCVVPAFAGEYAVLSNGFRLRAERHQVSGDTVLLYSSEGVTQLPVSAVTAYEPEEYVPPAPAEAATPPAEAPVQAASPRQLVERAANKAGLPPELVHSVAKAESALRVDAVSPKGAIGLMQLMPGTAAQLQANPRDPEQNADAGAMYLRELLLKYNGDVAKALAAYNAGPGAVDKYKGVPPYRETRIYVNRVIRNYKQLGGE